MTTKKAIQEKALVKWKGEQITVSFSDVKNLLCPLATDQETAIFLKTCQSLQLNPFAKEIYLIKYGERDKAAMVIAIDSYLKSAEANDNFNGFEAGIILQDSTGKLELREGSFISEGERDKLAGGWSRVYRKDIERSFYMAVNKKECLRYTREGNLTQFWTLEKQPMMLRKTALKRALVEAFPSLFVGTLSTAEVAGDEYEYQEIPERQLPPVLEKGGKPDWRKFWARVKSELGLTTEQARILLQVGSIKEELINAGWTMERIWDALILALQKVTEVKPQVVDTQTGEVTTPERGTLPFDQAAEAYFTPPEEDLFGEEKASGGAVAPTKTKPKQDEWRAFWERVEKIGLSQERVREMLGVTSIVEWTDQGKTLDEAILIISGKLAKPKVGVATPAETETKQPTSTGTPAKAKRDPATIKTISELYKACHQDWNMQPKDVIKELGYNSQSDITEAPNECYTRIAAVKEQ